MPLTTNIRELDAMPRGTAVAPDEITVGPQAGLQLEEAAGIDFPDGGLTRRRDALRDRARTRGLQQISRSTLDGEERVVLIVQWYCEQPGDVRVRKQPRRRRAGQNG